MTCDFYQTTLVKDNWLFKNIKKNVNALTPNFLQTYVQCYELNKFMSQFNMGFIQNLNKYYIAT